jgi:hypothetical protein
LFGVYLETSKWLNGFDDSHVSVHKKIVSSGDNPGKKMKIEKRDSLLGLARVVPEGMRMEEREGEEERKREGRGRI